MARLATPPLMLLLLLAACTATVRTPDVELRAAPGQVGARQAPGFVGFVLEVWLWLQFAIVVVVFLWAMAKRGPKNVIEEAERRRHQVAR